MECLIYWLIVYYGGENKGDGDDNFGMTTKFRISKNEKQVTYKSGGSPEKGLSPQLSSFHS